MEKGVKILLIISALIMILNVVLLYKYTGFTTSSQASISLIVEGVATPTCGDGICNSSIGETCSTCAADCGSCPVTPSAGGGGGGGGGAALQKDFSVDKTIIKVMTRVEESFKTSITIKNPENTPQDFKISSSSSLRGLVFVSDNSIYLEPGEEKTIDLTFVSGADTTPEVYTGNLEIKTASLTKKIPIVYSVKSKMILFDISLDIPSRYKEVFPGEEVLMQATLFNLGGVGKTDVTITYVIKDFEGNIIMQESEVLAVETQVSFSKTIKTPSNLAGGDYVAIAQVRYDASLGSSSVMFHVIEKETPLLALLNSNYAMVLMIIIAFVVLFFILLGYERKKMKNILGIQRREIKKIHEKIKRTKGLNIRSSSIRKKISSQRAALEKAHDAGYITRSSYEKGKTRLQNLGKKFR